MISKIVGNKDIKGVCVDYEDDLSAIKTISHFIYKGERISYKHFNVKHTWVVMNGSISDSYETLPMLEEYKLGKTTIKYDMNKNVIIIKEYNNPHNIEIENVKPHYFRRSKYYDSIHGYHSTIFQISDDTIIRKINIQPIPNANINDEIQIFYK